jgi:cysteine desulfuration protein SufE
MSATTGLPDLGEIAENLSFLEDWEERMKYVIDLGKALPPLPDDARTEANKVRGCASQVWLETTVQPGEPRRLGFRGDSDALIVRGLVAITLAMHDGRTADEILAADPLKAFGELGLAAHLSPQRSNGLRSMVERIRADARAALA